MYSNDLENLRSFLKARKVSLLVGAGFSKNVSDEHYPLWSGLLAKMVAKMQRKRHESDFIKTKGLDPKDAEDDFKVFVKERIDDYLSSMDSLSVVTEYVKNMGYRETVDVCIEENIPFLKRRDGRVYLVKGLHNSTEEVEINEADLYLHKKIVQLPWVNIYTTNYDNLLEVSIDDDTAGGLKQEILGYQTELQELVAKIDQKKKWLSEHRVNNDVEPHPQIGIVSLSGSDDDSQDQLSSPKLQEVLNAEYEMQLLSERVGTIQEKIFELGEAIKETYSVVTHSSMLGIKGQKNIIKLHGSLPVEEDCAFEFVNEFDKRYIISGDDYLAYPSKHEAFTQLMKISLLQGYFCLIGFSGDDPNFHAWVSWVRSIITRNSQGDINVEPKIFMVDARSKSMPDSHKLQYYKNHRIQYFPLLSEGCIQVLERHTGKRLDPECTKSVLEAFLSFLSEDMEPDVPQVAYELLIREKFEMIWSGEMLHHIDGEAILRKVLSNYDVLVLFYRSCRISSIEFLQSAAKVAFLNALPTAIIKDDSEDVERMLSIVVLLLNDLQIPFSRVVSGEIFYGLLKKAEGQYPSIYNSFLLIDFRDAIWTNDEDRCIKLEMQLAATENLAIQDDFFILRLLLAVNRLEFSKMHALLNEFSSTASNFNVLTAAGYWSLFDTAKGEDVLKGFRPQSIQDQMFALEIEYVLMPRTGFTQRMNKVQRLKKRGFKSMADNLSYVRKQLNPKKIKVSPYATDSRLVSTTVFSNNKDELLSIQLLGMMLRTGLPLARNGSTFQDKDEMYPIFQKALDYNPVIVLYLAFQYNYEDFIKRLSQDFTISQQLSIKPDQLFSLLQMAYRDSRTPKTFRRNILLFLSEFIMVVSVEKCNYFLTEMWFEFRRSEYASDRRSDEVLKFIQSAIQICDSLDVLAQIFSDCLEDAVKMPSNVHVINQIIYSVRTNPLHEKLVVDDREEIANYFRGIVSRISTVPESLYIVGNVRQYFNREQSAEIDEGIMELDLNKLSDPSLWSIIAYYGTESVAIQNKMKKSLLVNPGLWQTGFSTEPNGKWSWSKPNFIKMSRLLRRPGYSTGLILDDNDWRDFSAIIDSRLQEIVVDERFREDLFPLFQDMIYFLNLAILAYPSDVKFPALKERLENTIFTRERFEFIYMSLSEDRTIDINIALSEIALGVSVDRNWSIWEHSIVLVISKIILKKMPGIILCLEYLYDWSFDLQFRLKFGLKMLQIFSVYRESYPADISESILERALVRLALRLKGNNLQSDDIAYFTCLALNSRYSIVRQLSYHAPSSAAEPEEEIPF